MEKLPATSYVRLVDIWLIFCQLMPFIEVRLRACYVLYLLRCSTVLMQFCNVEGNFNHCC